MGSWKRTSGTTRSAGVPASRRGSTGATRISLTARGRLTVEEVDPDSGASKQLALVVRQQVLGSGRIDQGALRGAVESMKEIVLVAEEDDRLGFPVDEMTRLLGEFAADPPRLTAAGWHSDAASLLRPEIVCEPDRVSTREEEHGRAIALRRKAVALGREEEQQAAREQSPVSGPAGAWSDQLKVPDLPERIVGPLAEVASALKEISSLSSLDAGRLGLLLERIKDAVSEVVGAVVDEIPDDRGTASDLVQTRMAEVNVTNLGHAVAPVSDRPDPGAGLGNEGVSAPTPGLHGELLERLDGLNDRMTEALEPFSREVEAMLSRLNFASFKDLRLNQAFFEALNYTVGRMEKGWECPKEDRAPSVLRCYPATRMEEGAVTFEHSKDQTKGKKANHGGFKTFSSLKLISRIKDRLNIWLGERS